MDFKDWWKRQSVYEASGVAEEAWDYQQGEIDHIVKVRDKAVEKYFNLVDKYCKVVDENMELKRKNNEK